MHVWRITEKKITTINFILHQLLMCDGVQELCDLNVDLQETDMDL
jgi:hypothetical protein